MPLSGFDADDIAVKSIRFDGAEVSFSVVVDISVCEKNLSHCFTKSALTLAHALLTAFCGIFTINPAII